MKKGILLIIVMSIVGIAFYFYSQDIKEESYSKKFKEEFVIYGAFINKWNNKEDQIVKQYNEEVIESAKVKENVVESYEKIKEEIVPKTKDLIKEIEKMEAREDDTKKIKEEYIKLLNMQIEIFEMNYKSYEEQSEEIHNQAKEKMETYKKEREKFNKKLSNIYEKVEINLMTKEE